MDNTPTREELRAAFGIENDDFEIRLGPLPPLTTQPPGRFVEKQEFSGRPVHLLRDPRGWVLIIALIPSGFTQLMGDPYATVRLSDSDHEPVSTISNESQNIKCVATTPSPHRVIPNPTPQEWDVLPTGSTLRLVFPDQVGQTT